MKMNFKDIDLEDEYKTPRDNITKDFWDFGTGNYTIYYDYEIE